MKPGAGKQKGGEFERDTCKKLSLWVTAGEREDLFWRSAMSGGRATLQIRRGNKNLSQIGDITAIDPLGTLITDHFIVECKFYQDLQIVQSLVKGSGKLKDFFVKLHLLCREQGRHPLLIAKQNRLPTLMLTTVEGADALGLVHMIKGKKNYYVPLFHAQPWCAEVYTFEDVLRDIPFSRR